MVAQVAEQFLAHKPVNFASLFYFILFYVIRFALKITKTKTKKNTEDMQTLVIRM